MKLKHIKVDSLYGKKKHFNAAERLERYHYGIGIPLIIINVLTSSVLFYILTDGVPGWVKFVPIILAFIAAILSSFQTYLNLPQKVEKHRRIANGYLSVMKKCDRLQGYINDGLINSSEFLNKIEELSCNIEEINNEAELFPASVSDFELAKEGINKGEEDYTKKELEL